MKRTVIVDTIVTCYCVTRDFPNSETRTYAYVYTLQSWNMEKVKQSVIAFESRAVNGPGQRLEATSHSITGTPNLKFIAAQQI